jgi:nicotinate-nucleotide adenylyltransferase
MRLGILGGTFDPPHFGHLILAQYAAEQLALDKVRFIPAGDPYRKAGREISPALQRLEMVRLAAVDNDLFEVDDIEVRREGPTYTVETLRALRAKLAAADEIFFVLGEDALADLPHWREPEAIAAEARIAVVPRAGGPLPPEIPFDPDRLDRIEMPYIGISSTELRQRARLGLPLRYMVPRLVEAYVVDNGLYRRPIVG